MDCHSEHVEHGHGDHGHDHGHGGHDHSHVPQPHTSSAQTLYNRISHAGIRTLNESEDGAGASVFKDWESRLDTKKFLESDVDEQLLIHVPFTGLCKIHSLLIRTTNDDSAPRHIKLFKNRDDLDFSSASDLSANHVIEHPEGVGGTLEQSIEAAPSSSSLDSEGIAEYALSRAQWSNITSLTMFVEDNYGDDVTRILYIGLRGEFKELNRAPVVTLYESAANPADHKKIVPGEEYVGDTL